MEILVPHSWSLPEGFQDPEFYDINEYKFQQFVLIGPNLFRLTFTLCEKDPVPFGLTLFDVVVIGLAVVKELMIELMELSKQHLMCLLLLSQTRPLIMRVNCVITAVFLDL